MKKHLMRTICVSIAFITLFATNSCRKDIQNSEITVQPKTLDLIAEAKLYFNNSIKEVSREKDLNSSNDKNQFQLLNKKVLWDDAKVKKMASGEAVRVPIYYDEETFIKAGKDKRAMSLYNLSYLMMYKDKKGKMQMEWVITIPDDDYVDRKRNSGVKFTGIIHVLDWKGNLIKSYRYFKDESVSMGTKMTFTKENNLKVASNKQPIKQYDYWAQGCVSNTYWTCVSITSTGNEYCGNFYSVETCYNIYVIEPKGKEIPISEGGGGGGPYDYIPDENDCPVSGNPENPGDQPPTDRNSPMSTSSSNCDGTINRDTINNLNNADADCIFERLKNNVLFQNLLANFQNNKNLNITFQMGNPVDENGNSVNGSTSHVLGTTNFTITIDNNYLNLRGGIEVAKTFLHEAFHANLYTQAQLWYPSDLPTNFQNWSLVDQIKYIDNRSGHIAGFSNSHQHNYIATQIDQIANGIRAYTLANYPTIYSNPNATFDSYRAMAYGGLTGTQCYATYIKNLPNGQTSFDNAYRELISKIGENKCP
ncbi:hypothetical protein [Pedobacter cryophilus]|uniref:Uncharacterized protein n=1 Tax=Pedobacter cryophilus TaxID=2571271 RepID=A0A4U1BU22_9SPHI|nr:hypothetical protein [Pedobacter cryophilus]TKB95536.1 hypothetical protein FA046_16170 [Pedobacter cryophilus]